MQRKRAIFLIASLASAMLLISLAIFLPPAPSTPLGLGMAAIGALILLHAAYRMGRPFPLILIAAVLWLASGLMVRYTKAQGAYFTAIAVFSVVLSGLTVVCMATATIIWFKDGLEKFK